MYDSYTLSDQRANGLPLVGFVDRAACIAVACMVVVVVVAFMRPLRLLMFVCVSVPLSVVAVSVYGSRPFVFVIAVCV